MILDLLGLAYRHGGGLIMFAGLAAHALQRHNINVSKEDIVITAGGVVWLVHKIHSALDYYIAHKTPMVTK
jgi:hypothetical protein